MWTLDGFISTYGKKVKQVHLDIKNTKILRGEALLNELRQLVEFLEAHDFTSKVIIYRYMEL